jgi:hypothetical protein
MSMLRAAISCEIMGIDKEQFCGAAYCDEIVNSVVMLIATAKSLYLPRFEANQGNDALQSTAYGLAARR